MRLLLGKRGPGQRAERERREAGHRSGRGHYQIIKVGRIRQMSGIGPWRWNQINDNPCIVALYHKLLRLLCQECLYPRCRCWSLIMWPDTCHMTPGGNWSRGKTRGSQSVKITLDLGGKNHHKTNTCCINNLLWWLATSHELLWNYLKLCLAIEKRVVKLRLLNQQPNRVLFVISGF